MYYTAEYTIVKILLALLTYFYEDYMYVLIELIEGLIVCCCLLSDVCFQSLPSISCMLFVVDCFPVHGVCCNGHVYSGSSVGFKRTLPCKWTLVHSVIIVCFVVGLIIEL